MRFFELVESLYGIQSDYEGPGPLYHGTDLLSLSSILASGYLTPSIDTDRDARTCGVSLTTSKPMAWSFADRSSVIFHDNHGFDAQREQPELFAGAFPTRGGVITFDAEKLRRVYRLVNYVDDGMDDELEVRVICPRLLNVQQFIVAVDFNPGDIDWFIAYCQSKEAAYEYSDPKAVVARLMALKSRS